MEGGSELARFYDAAYTHDDEGERLRFAHWRALGAVGKADHVVGLCRQAGIAPRAVVDVGCGDGALLAELGARGFGETLSGFEITEAAVRLARVREGVRSVEVFDGERLPADDRAFDLGILSHVLEHVPDPALLLAEVARVATAVLVEVPLEANVSARRGAKREHANEIGHLQRFDRAAVQALVERSGLRVVAALDDPLPLAAHLFFAAGASARARGAAKWALRATVAGAAPPLARRLFTVHHACLALPTG